jgi:hypothetical protein
MLAHPAPEGPAAAGKAGAKGPATTTASAGPPSPSKWSSATGVSGSGVALPIGGGGAFAHAHAHAHAADVSLDTSCKEVRAGLIRARMGSRRAALACRAKPRATDGVFEKRVMVGGPSKNRNAARRRRCGALRPQATRAPMTSAALTSRLRAHGGREARRWRRRGALLWVVVGDRITPSPSSSSFRPPPDGPPKRFDRERAHRDPGRARPSPARHR